MALDLANGYARKDAASASNVYYAYIINQDAADTDKVFALRRVTNVAGVETVTWANGSRNFFASSWAGRTYSFAAPGGSLELAATSSTISVNSAVTHRVANFSWTLLQGVNQYLVTSLDSSGRLLFPDGQPIQGQYVDRGHSTNLINTNTYTQNYLTAGTHSFRVTAVNVAGTTSSVISVNFPS